MGKKDVVNVDPATGPDTAVAVTLQDGIPVAIREITERQPLPIPEGGWPADEFTGEAGKFVRDPFTGVRSRAVE